MSESEFLNLYQAYGLRVASSIDLPELTSIDALAASDVDITIKQGSVTDRLLFDLPEEGWCFAKDDLCVLRFPDIGMILVDDGQRITVEKHPNAALSDLSVFVVGSALATAMHQRGLVSLHVSALLSPTGVVAFTGQSGAGKSTMAAHLHQKRQWPLISDDVSRLHLSNDGAFLESGVNTVKLWADALESLGRDRQGLRRDVVRFDKFHAIDRGKFVDGKFMLDRLFLLEWGDREGIEKLSGRQAFQAIMSAFYRPELATLCGNRDRLVDAAFRMASMIDVFVLTRPENTPVEQGIVDSIDLAFPVTETKKRTKSEP